MGQERTEFATCRIFRFEADRPPVRQIQGHLRADGVVRYCDPFLKAEALGGRLQWDELGNTHSLRWPSTAIPGELPCKLRGAEESAKSGRVPVACEVLRRMALLPNRDFCLAVSLTGPITLATRILQFDESCERTISDYSSDVLDLANSTTTQIAMSFLEAGAELILIQEDIIPAITAENCEAWMTYLAPILNVARFYGALPALQIQKLNFSQESYDAVLQQPWDCVICLPLDTSRSRASKAPALNHGTMLGISVPTGIFMTKNATDQTLRQLLPSVIGDFRTVLVTTQSDVPGSADMKTVISVLQDIRGLVTGST